jgi:hypothetical protein
LLADWEIHVGVSETIVAAMIGASATVMAALFQLFRAGVQAQTRPKRSAIRSAIAMVALMLASAVGGFGYAELRAADAREDIRLLRTELNAQLNALATSTKRIEELGRARSDASQEAQPVSTLAPPAPMSSESIVRLPACQHALSDVGPAPLCDPAEQTRVTLCAEIPSTARQLSLQVYGRPAAQARAWEASSVDREDASQRVWFARDSMTYAAATQMTPVCVAASNRDAEQDYLARVVVHYQLDAPVPPATVAVLPQAQLSYSSSATP